MGAAAGTVMISAGSVAAQEVPNPPSYYMADGSRTANYEAATQSWRDDSQFSVDYSKGYLGMEHAYARGLSGRGVTVGVVDSGVHFNHPSFSGRDKLRGLNTDVGPNYGNNGEVNERLYWVDHGTHVAGIVAGNRLENGTMFGGAYNANIVSANMNFSGGDIRHGFDGTNGGRAARASDLLLAMAQDPDARIVNNSWGNAEFSDISQELIETILRNDKLFVWAAGNDNVPARGYKVAGTDNPELRSNWLAVANYKENDTKVPSSNTCGDAATYCVAAPGFQIVSAGHTGLELDREGVRALDPDLRALLRQDFATMDEIYDNAASLFEEDIDTFVADRKAAGDNGEDFDLDAALSVLGRRGALINLMATSISVNPSPNGASEIFSEIFESRQTVEDLGADVVSALLDQIETNRIAFYEEFFSSDGLGFVVQTGTSMASPSMAAFAAILVERFPEYSTALITDIIASTARDIGSPGVDEVDGWGVAQMKEALGGPMAMRGVREVEVGFGTYDVWIHDITDARERYNAAVRRKNPDDIGGLTKVGGGELILNGDNSYTGATRAEGGLLTVDGRILNSDLTVADNGIVGGIGSLVSLVADAGGVVAPGNTENPFGTLTVTGDALFRPGSNLWVRSGVDGDPHSKLAVQGSTTLEGGNVILKADQGTWNLRTKDLRILTSTGGVSGEFDEAESDLAFLTPSLSYTRDAVILTLDRNDVSVSAAGENNNQRATGRALDSLIAPVETATNSPANDTSPDADDGSELAPSSTYSTPEPEPTTDSSNDAAATVEARPDASLQDALIDSSLEAMRLWLPSLTGEVHASLGAVATADSQLIRDAMLERGRGEALTGLLTPLNTRGLNFWATGVHNEGRFDGNQEQGRFRTEANGFAVGIDKTVERGHLGIAYGENTSELDQHRLSSNAKSRSRHVGLYGGLTSGQFALRAGGSWFETNNDTRRDAQVNAFTDLLNGDYDGDGWQAYVEGAWSRSFGATALEPYVNYARVEYNADVSETGAEAALSGEFSETADLLSAGIRSRTLLAGGDTRPALTLVGHLAWTENLNDDGAVFRARFADSPEFDVISQTLTGDALQTALSVNVQTSQRSAVDVGYSGTHGSDYSNNRLFARFSVKF